MMQSDIDTILSDLLAAWHQWAKRYQFGKGYPSADATCRGHRASRQYDDANGALDDAGHQTRMEGMDAAINRVPQPWNAALHTQARNMATGNAVWSNPRLPRDPMERGVLLLEARNRLLRELSRDGVLS